MVPSPPPGPPPPFATFLFWPSVWIWATVPPNPVVLLFRMLLKALTDDPAAALMPVPLFDRMLSLMMIVPLAAIVATPLVVFAANRHFSIVAKPFVLTVMPFVLPSKFESL